MKQCPVCHEGIDASPHVCAAQGVSPYRTGRARATSPRVVTGGRDDQSGYAPPTVLLADDTIEGLGVARLDELRGLALEPDLGVYRLVAVERERRVVLARGFLHDLKDFAEPLGTELGVPVTVDPASDTGRLLWTRLVDSNGTIALARTGRDRVAIHGRGIPSVLGRDCFHVDGGDVDYAPRTPALSMRDVDYFDVVAASTPTDRRVMARKVNGAIVVLFTRSIAHTLELCARLAVELTNWRLGRFKQRGRRPPG